MIRRSSFALLLACWCAGAVAADPPEPTPAPKSFVTKHEIQIAGKKLRYRAIAEELDVADFEGKPQARIFSTTYLIEGAADARHRPVVFAFNGGPGSASMWLHMGLLGPKRVRVPSDAKDDGAPPLDIVDNAYSPLDVADVVLIDPVGTGYSRAINGHADKEFWGIAQDADVLANFVRQWLTRQRRWDAPKYLFGESYGTTRAAAMTRALAQEEFGSVALNGVVLMSAALDFQGLRPLAHNGRVS